MSGGVTIIKIDNPPLNTLTKVVRLKFLRDLEDAIQNPVCKIIMIVGCGRAFSVGANIKELESQWISGTEHDAMTSYVKAYSTHNLAPLVYQIDRSPKPIVALIDGPAFGGGLEIALGCQYRVSSERSSFQFPEVKIGIIPGALGTQLLPRLTTFETSLAMCVGCKLLSAKEALQAGVVDQIIPLHAGRSQDLEERMVRVLENQILRGNLAPHPFRKTSELPVTITAQKAMAAAFKYRSDNPHILPAVNRGGQAARGAMEALLAAAKYGRADSFQLGALTESEISKTLVVSLEAQALRYVFLAERAAAHSSPFGENNINKSRRRHHSDVTMLGRSPAALSRDTEAVQRINGKRVEGVDVTVAGVVGSGVMGAGIAATLLMARYTVVLCDLSAAALKNARKSITSMLLAAVTRKLITSAMMTVMMTQLSTSTMFESLSQCDMVIEAVFEDLSIKQQLFLQLDKVCKPSCLLASNTSSLEIDFIALLVRTERLPYVLGMHFFTPAHVMKLLEVVQCTHTSPSTSLSAMAVAKRLKKVGVLVSNLPGFVGNRCIFPYALESMLLLEEKDSETFAGTGGLTVAKIDQAIRNFGFAIGPFQMADLSGLDVGYRIRKEMGLVEGEAETGTSAGSSSGCKDDRRGHISGSGGGRHTGWGGGDDEVTVDIKTSRYSRIGDELFLSGRQGVKNGRGFYEYKATRGGRPIAQPDRAVEDVIRREITRKHMLLGQTPNTSPTSLSAGGSGSVSGGDEVGESELIIQRLLCPLINEAFKLLGEGGVVSGRPGDVDIVFIRGYGWPAYKGGPLFFADKFLSLPVLFHRLERFSVQFPSSAYYQPSLFLRAMVEQGVGVMDLQLDCTGQLLERLRRSMKRGEDSDMPLPARMKSFL